MTKRNSAAPDVQTQTILIIDDNPNNLATLTDYLAEYDFEVLIARNGERGIERAQFVCPDLILLDIVMPGMDGFETCRRLKSDPRTESIPVIFLTALTETEHKVESFKVGAVDYITKPLQREEILARVLTHLRLRALNERLEQQVRDRTDALHESEAKYRNLVENANDGIAIVQQGLLKYANRYLTDIAGLPLDAAINRPFTEFVYPDELSKVTDYYQRRMVGETVPQIYESAIKHREGHKVAVELNVSLTTYQGEPAELVVIRDITERKQAEEERARLLMELQEHAQRVQKIIDTVPEGVVLLDANLCVILVNPMAVNDLRILADAQLGDRLTHLGGSSLDKLLTSPPKGLWHEVSTGSQEFQIIARSIETGPALGGWVLVIRDVTQQRRLDQQIQQRERLAAVGQLAAGIAHDFNNIMATVVLYAQMTARAKDVPERVRERMLTINQQAQHATDLIRQILDFSRRSVIERRPMDLLPFLNEQVKLLERTLPEDIKISLLYEPNEYVLNADPTGMQQMVMNLVVNARDAMPKGGELSLKLDRVHIDSHNDAPLPHMNAGDWVQLTVSDTGMGIPKEALPHIFEPFFTTKEPGQGSGLGLAQVDGIVGSHEGYIRVDSKPDIGTTFYIYFPALPLQSLQSPVSPRAKALPHGQGETLLLVEDNAATRVALLESLTLLNYHVLEAANGEEALVVLEHHAQEIAMIVSDVVMPDMGGIALLHALREKHILKPMLLLTGHPLENELKVLHTSEAAASPLEWMLKPPSIEQLAETIKSMLSYPRP